MKNKTKKTKNKNQKKKKWKKNQRKKKDKKGPQSGTLPEMARKFVLFFFEMFQEIVQQLRSEKTDFKHPRKEKVKE